MHKIGYFLLLTIALFLLEVTPVCASVISDKQPIGGEYATLKTPYSITVLGEYSYNLVYEHHGNVDIKANLPFTQHFEMEPMVQISSANVYSGAINTRALFPLPVGKLYLENRLLYKYLRRNDMYDFCAALNLGYRMDYVNVQIGMFGRFMDNMKRDWHTEDETICEPYNLLYRVEVFCRPQTCKWNLSAAISNFDDFQMERMWQLLFMVGAKYSVTDHIDLHLDAECKPTGMFHLNASFYGATARLGLTYKF